MEGLLVRVAAGAEGLNSSSPSSPMHELYNSPSTIGIASFDPPICHGGSVTRVRHDYCAMIDDTKSRAAVSPVLY